MTVRTKAADPNNWAETQANLGNMWAENPTGDKAENFCKAIDCFEAALTVRTKVRRSDPLGRDAGRPGADMVRHADGRQVREPPQGHHLL